MDTKGKASQMSTTPSIIHVASPQTPPCLKTVVISGKSYSIMVQTDHCTCTQSTCARPVNMRRLDCEACEACEAADADAELALEPVAVLRSSSLLAVLRGSSELAELAPELVVSVVFLIAAEAVTVPGAELPLAVRPVGMSPPHCTDRWTPPKMPKWCSRPLCSVSASCPVHQCDMQTKKIVSYKSTSPHTRTGAKTSV